MKRLNNEKEENEHRGHLKRKILEWSLRGCYAEDKERSCLCHSGQDYEIWSWTAWVQIPSRPLHSSVTSGVLLILSGPVSSFVKWVGGGNKNFYLIGFL